MVIIDIFLKCRSSILIDEYLARPADTFTGFSLPALQTHVNHPGFQKFFFLLKLSRCV